MDTILLNGESYRLGVDRAISLGYNTKGHMCIAECTVNRDDDSDQLYALASGVWVIVPTGSLTDFYLDTPENRKKLRAQIKGNG